MLIIGRNPIVEALKFNPQSIKKLLILEGTYDKKVKDIIETAKKKHIAVELKSKESFRKFFDEGNKSEGISQGIAAVAEEFEYSDFHTLVNELSVKKEAVLVVLDEIQDPHNLGAIIRTSAASGADAVIVSQKNSAKVTHTVIKSSAGAVNFIPIAQVSNIYDSIQTLKNKNFKVIGTESRNGTEYFNYPFPPLCAVVFGNEGYGIRKNVLKLCDDLIRIPLSGKVQSLNVSVSAGIILYEIQKSRKRT